MEEASGIEAARNHPIGGVPLPTVYVLVWNLFHGRAVPPVDRSLYAEFAAKLDEWDWDMALLQEVPPWWPQRLAGELGVDQRSARTSRNSLLPLRRALAERRPELVKSNGGGCNAILSRMPIVEHSTVRLRRWPERRVAQFARLDDGTALVNLHASTRPARAGQELARTWAYAMAWAGSGRLILGGDLNLRTPPAAPAAAYGDPSDRGAAIAHVAGCGVDHVFARGLLACGGESAPPSPIMCRPPGRDAVLDGRRVALSDHAPLLVSLRTNDSGH